jgi:hypothetical protein
MIQKYKDILNESMISKKRRLSDMVRLLGDEGLYIKGLRDF